jgi:hypothetical protein
VTIDKLRFQQGNAKLADNIFTFSLPAGHTCPGAKECFAKVGRDGGLVDGKDQLFRCFAASAEAFRASIRKSRWHNLDLLRALDTNQMAQLILDSLPTNARLVRVHVSGDFFSESYFLAWMKVASLRSEVRFYAYTKSIKTWVDNLDRIPSNFRLTASYGGRWDCLIDQYNLKSAKVVFSIEEAMMLGLDVDHDDSHAYDGDKSFALVLHGTQPAGSVAAKSLSALKAQGFAGYNAQRRKTVLA